ncbi:MAG: pyridoxal phosphate-dependent aminotransferase [Deltaproteobacteria bacterium]|jgi:aspartate aminotransferase|nr:pyridoxal phosphate-dependent aminotransferase [Deltaproteobacteria bacterium]
MGVLSDQCAAMLESSSWIRRMFETGMELKKQHGADKVSDFSLGNPDLPPPPEVAGGLRELEANLNRPFSFGYMPNCGFDWALRRLAAYLSEEQGVKLEEGDLMLGCGAAGCMNAFLKAVLNPGDEILCIAPYFVEYGAYVSNHGGVLRPVPAKQADFSPDLPALEKAFGPKTRGIIINSPNNPTGQIYSKDDLAALAELLRRKSREYKRPIFLLSDEPYRFLAYDGAEVPAVLPLYEYAVVLGSFSKSLSLPGERIGYLALAPHMPDKALLRSGAITANRTLGFVNPPLVGQYLLKHALGKHVDLNVYAARREVMTQTLTAAGYEFIKPRGAFYFFPKAPGGNDTEFVRRLAEELVLAVPGSGFGMPGFFRLAFCVSEAEISRALDGLKRARAHFA